MDRLIARTSQERYNNVAEAWHFLGFLDKRQYLNIRALTSNPDFNNLSEKLIRDILVKANKASK